MKWSDRKGNWMVPSLSYNLQKFTGSSFKICLSRKKCPRVWISYGCHVALRELLRLSDVLANRSFCRSDISRVQLKSNWTVGERLLASDQEAVREYRLILFKTQWNFLQCLNLKIYSFGKKKSVMEFLTNIDGTHGILQTDRWLCEPIILSIGNFDGPTGVQLNSWWKVASLWSRGIQRFLFLFYLIHYFESIIYT